MDATRFGRWTRRSFGHVAAGAVAALVGAPAVADARKKRCKKTRCRNLRQTCQPGDSTQSCCQGLNCDPVSGQGTLLLCCRGRQQRCESSAECCGTTICLNVAGLSEARCCGTGGEFCASAIDCCQGYDCAAGACAAVSDRALKANFGSVDPADMLDRIRSLPISTWNYACDDASIRHIGPMAQDFAALFGVGADDRHIHPLDGQGVALAAIQGIAGEIAALRGENARLAARLAVLETGGKEPA